MVKKSKQKSLQKKLKKIIKKMQRIQKNIAADEQPLAMHELDTLTELGEQYAAVVSAMETEKV